MHSLYNLFGSEATNLEHELLAEDWIGYMKFGDLPFSNRMEEIQ